MLRHYDSHYYATSFTHYYAAIRCQAYAVVTLRLLIALELLCWLQSYYAATRICHTYIHTTFIIDYVIIERGGINISRQLSSIPPPPDIYWPIPIRREYGARHAIGLPLSAAAHGNMRARNRRHARLLPSAPWRRHVASYASPSFHNVTATSLKVICHKAATTVRYAVTMPSSLYHGRISPVIVTIDGIGYYATTPLAATPPMVS